MWPSNPTTEYTPWENHNWKKHMYPNIPSEVSQKEKNKYDVNAYMWNLRRRYWWTYLQGSNGDKDIQNRLVDTVEEGRTNWEQHGNIHITICKTDSQWACAVWHRELNPVLRNYLEGWDGAGDRGSRERKHMCTCSWFMMYGRNQYNIVETSTIL